MRNKKSFLFILCGMLIIPGFTVNTQVKACEKLELRAKRVNEGGLVDAGLLRSCEHKELIDVAGLREGNEIRTDKNNNENLDSKTGGRKTKEEETKDKDSNKAKTKKKSKKKKIRRHKKNKKKSIKKSIKKNNKKHKKSRANIKRNNKKVTTINKKKQKSIDNKINPNLREEEVNKLPETDKYKPELKENSNLFVPGIVNGKSPSNSDVKKNNMSKYAVFCESTDKEGRIIIKAGSLVNLPTKGLIGLIETGENTGKEIDINWEGKDLDNVKNEIRGNYTLTANPSENVIIGGKDYGDISFLVDITVE